MAQDETEQIRELPPEDAILHPCLMILSGDSAGKIYRLQEGTMVAGRAEDADIVLSDRGISRRHAQFTLSPEGDVTVSDLGSTNGSFLGPDRIDSAKLFGGERLRLGASVRLKFDFRDHGEEQLLESAARDPLTGALNRSYFDHRLTEAWAKAKRYQSTLSCAFIDVDHFKKFNDTYGHAAGDAVLQELVQRVSALKRQEDTFARYGGEEFVMLLPDTELEGAKQLLERIRISIQEQPFSIPAEADQTGVQVTVSVGVASKMDSMESAKLLIEEADKALYQAKAKGRNRVICASY